jgi:hypothetical protein
MKLYSSTSPVAIDIPFLSKGMFQVQLFLLLDQNMIKTMKKKGNQHQNPRVIEEQCHGWEYHNKDNRRSWVPRPTKGCPLGMEQHLWWGYPEREVDDIDQVRHGSDGDPMEKEYATYPNQQSSHSHHKMKIITF